MNQGLATVNTFMAGTGMMAGTFGGIAAAPTVASASVGIAARGVGAIAAYAGGTGLVLGKYPEYIESAEAIGANKFKLNDKLYSFLDYFDHAWTANQAFIDVSVFRGQQFS
jgi:hypothetical protein